MTRNYALITDGVVSNVIWLNDNNVTDFPTAVPCDTTPVQIGDIYIEGQFYRDGVAVETSVAERLLLEEQLLDALAAIAVLEEALNG